MGFPNHVNRVLEAKGWFAKAEARARGARNLAGDQPPVAAAPQAPAAQMNLQQLREQQKNGGTSAPSPAPADLPKEAAHDTCAAAAPVPNTSPNTSAQAPKSAPLKSAFDFEKKNDVAKKEKKKKKKKKK